MTGRFSAGLERALTKHVYYSMTQSLCGVCQRSVDAKIHLRRDGVFFDKFCPAHGAESVCVSSSVQWYLEALTLLAPSTPPSGPRPVAEGCPRDCGPCALHQQRTHWAVLPMGDAVALSRASEALDGTPSQAGRVQLRVEAGQLASLGPILGNLQRDVGQRLELCCGPEVVWEALPLDALADHGVDLELAVPAMDSAGSSPDRLLRGLERFGAAGINVALAYSVETTLELAALREPLRWLAQLPPVWALRIALRAGPATKGNASGAERLTLPDVHQALEGLSEGRLSGPDFVPLPQAHSHCFSVCPLLVGVDGSARPLARILGRPAAYGLLASWGFGAVDPERVRAAFADHPMHAELDAWDASRVERACKRVDIHHYMDVHAFDVGRAMKCPVSAMHEGGSMPACVQALPPYRSEIAAANETAPAGSVS